MGLWRSSDFIRKVAAITMNRGLVMGMGFLISVVLVRELGPEGRGIYVSAFSVTWIGIQLGNLGLQVPHTLVVTRNKENLASLTANSLAAGMLVGGGCAVLAGVVFLFFPAWAPVQWPLLGMSLLWVPLGIIYHFFYHLLIGIQDVRGFIRIDSVCKAIQLAAVLALAWFFDAKVEWFFACGLVLLAVGCVWQFLQLKGHFQGSFRPSSALYRGIFFQGIKAYLIALFSFLLFRIDLLIVRYLLGPGETGYYSVASSLADVIPVVPSVVGTILFPKLSALSDAAERWKLVRKAVWGTSLFLLPGMGLAFLLAGPAIKMFYGTEFLPAVKAFQLLLPGIYFLAIQVVALQFLKSEKIPNGILWGWVGAVILNVVMNFLLIPAYGIAGASIASSVCYFLIFVITWVVIGTQVRTMGGHRFVGDRKGGWLSSLGGLSED